MAIPKVLVTDDDERIRNGISRILKASGYEVLTATDGQEALEAVREHAPDVVVSDVTMPRMTGLELTKKIKTDDLHWRTRVLLVSSQAEMPDRVRATDCGADGFLSKPFQTPELLAGVSARVSEKKLLDQLEGPEAVLLTLANVIASRDDVTGGHCHRLSHLSSEVGRELGLSSDDVRALEWGGVLHDIGKVSVPDAILLAPRKLSSEEREIMELHTIRGEETLRPLKLFAGVLPIVRSHHERRDGSGYPDKLKGDDIPITARVLQVVDVYDALRSVRPYKPGWSFERSLQQVYAEVDLGWWDPQVVETFASVIRRLDAELYDSDVKRSAVSNASGV